MRSRKTAKVLRSGESKAARSRPPREVVPTAAGRENAADSAAFIPNPEETHRRVPDDLAEYLGEGFIQSVTGNDDAEPGGADASSPEELGGPFIETDAVTEYASGASQDLSDDDDGQTVPEAFPTAVRGGVEPGRTADDAALLETASAEDEDDAQEPLEAADDDADANDDEEEDEGEEVVESESASTNRSGKRH